MFRNLFKNNNPVSIKKFLLNVKEENQTILDSLNLSQSDFEEASGEELLSNSDDLVSGVNRVQKKFDTTFFKLFENMLIKHHDNGDVKYIFYTQTNDANKIIEIADFIFGEFGNGYYDDRKHTPFHKKEKVISLSQGKYLTNRDEIVHVWLLDKYSIVLQYRIQPMRQFVLSVTEKQEKEVNKSVRRKGTILNHLKLDANALLQESEIDKEVEIEKNTIKFIDYFFNLKPKEFGVFDIAKLRIFGGEREFREDIQTHLTLMASNKISYQKMISISDKLIEIYGEDDSGTGEMEIHDMEALEEDFWTGRTWHFNEIHGLWNMDNKNEKMTYNVMIEYDEEDNGFKISILGYNSLVDYFGIK